MKTPIKMVISEYDLLPKGSEVCEAEGVVVELRDQLKVVNREWEKANIEILKLAKEISRLKSEHEDRVAELEEDEANHHTAYRGILFQRDQYFNKNQALKRYIEKGGLKIPDADQLEVSQLREKVYQYERAIEHITNREISEVNGYDPDEGTEGNIVSYLMRVTAPFRVKS